MGQLRAAGAQSQVKMRGTSNRELEVYADMAYFVVVEGRGRCLCKIEQRWWMKMEMDGPRRGKEQRDDDLSCRGVKL